MNWANILHVLKEGNPATKNDRRQSDEYWKGKLKPEVYRITRLHGTEAPFSGELCESFEDGKYACSCCGEELFDSSIKFSSSSGWPSFTEPIHEQAIKYIKDESHGMIRVEIQCNSCDAHLGHVFPDGPEPSGLRYCVNSFSLQISKENAIKS